MLDMRDTGNRKGGMTGGMKLEGLEVCRRDVRKMQERKDSRDEGCKFGSAIALIPLLKALFREIKNIRNSFAC